MATFGIHGAVDQFSDLPDPSRFDLQTTFIVRQDTGAPHGAGLYRVQLQDGAYFWDFFDSLSMQRADEVPYDNQASGLAAENLQQAVDLLAAGGNTENGSSSPAYIVIAGTSGTLTKNSMNVLTSPSPGSFVFPVMLDGDWVGIQPMVSGHTIRYDGTRLLRDARGNEHTELQINDGELSASRYVAFEGYLGGLR